MWLRARLTLGMSSGELSERRSTPSVWRCGLRGEHDKQEQCRSGEEVILAREASWKRILFTRSEHGLNRN